MKKLIITESERQEISAMHGLTSQDHGKEGLVNEQGGILKRALSSVKGALRSAENAVLSLPSISKLGLKNIDEVIASMSKLSARERGEVLLTLFKNTKGRNREKIATVFTNTTTFKKKYLKPTEKSTRDALKRSGKYADDEIEIIINAHKKNTGSKWSSGLRKAGSYSKLGDDIKKQIEKITARDYPGKKFSTLGQGSREKVIKEALRNSSKKFGIKITKEVKGTLKKVLKMLGLTVASITSMLGLASLFSDDSTSSSDNNQTTGTQTTGTQTIPKNWMNGILNKEWTLMVGSQNQTGYDNLDEAIKAFQRALKVKDDGLFGPNTKKAVVNFQRSNGLSADGIIGDNTLRKMIEKGLISEN